MPFDILNRYMRVKGKGRPRSPKVMECKICSVQTKIWVA